MRKSVIKTIQIICFVAICFIGRGQNYSFAAYDTIKYGNPGELFIDSLILVNNTSSPVKMFLHRIVKNIPSGWTSCFCNPECIAQTQDTLTFYIPVDGNHMAGQAFVSPNFGTDSIPGVGEVIVVLNEVGVNHYDTVRFRAITTSLAGIYKPGKENFIVYPNPVQKALYIKDLNKHIKSIKLFNSLGIEVSNCNVDFFNEEIEVLLTNFDTGNYYLQIETSDRLVYRKKITKM